MYLLLDKAKPLSFHFTQRLLSFPLIYQVIEEWKWHKSKNMITLSTVDNPKMIPLVQVIHKIG